MEAAVRIGERLKRLRDERGWTQVELARKVDASQSTIAGIESGSQLPGTGLLGRLADLFRIDMDYFYRAKENPFEMLLRAEEVGSQLQPVLRDFTEWCLRYAEIERIAGQIATPAPDYSEYFSKSTERLDLLERLAEESRRRLELGAGQNCDLPEILERDGLRVMGIQTEEDLDGVFLYAQDEGGFALVNTNRSSSRQLFTLAHEYGHFLLHRKLGYRLDVDVTRIPSKGDVVESTAGRFAAAFLMPRSTIESLWQKQEKDMTRIIWVRRMLGVSYRALGWRLLNLKLITLAAREKLESDEDALRNQEKLLFKDESEPCLKVAKFSDRLRLVSYLAYLRGEVSVSRLADWLDMDVVTADTIARSLRGEEEPHVPTAY